MLLKSSIKTKKPYSVRKSVADLTGSDIDKNTVCEIMT